ncbi:DNA sulfur modification protein DndD [Bordetella genomosp. 7]|uniref:DNA sulfur modification protein DndD n=1 Tax=Bordetella genomosp. 7 TaxID=1416805 RepID=A0A261QTX7_9BORD|nr:DNA sulfur modification protein DndD [Bordetella genomosp. 7]OZI16208.1 DNA sulfur modification protein DndD [Bordetella genomosp. 7]
MAKITISSISIENFGPFRERQTIDLTVKAARPVILVKALNGSGKTTLLTALQVGLYGHKALTDFRRSEYEQLLRGLQRKDTQGNAVIEIGVAVEIGGLRRRLMVQREWTRKGNELVERLSVFEGGNKDLHFSLTWDEFIGSILPAELVQLFLFDGEKIEALANPDRLPDLLKRATEVFLGIGGIESLANDLKALERRAMLKSKNVSADFDAARTSVSTWRQQAEELEEKLQRLAQDQAASRNSVEQAQLELDRFSVEAQRHGLKAYEQAAEIKNSVVVGKKNAELARAKLVEAISDPVLPIAWLPKLWAKYREAWDQDQHARHARLLAQEFKRRDQRIVTLLESSLPRDMLDALRKTLSSDLRSYTVPPTQSVALQEAPAKDTERDLSNSKSRLKEALADLKKAQSELDKAEQRIGQIPAEEQIAGVLRELQERSKVVSAAETQLADTTRRVEEMQGQLNHVRIRLNAAQERLGVEFRDRSLEAKSLDASGRARKALALFKERLLASKAQWLSTVITAEFRNLLRKRNLIAKVLVDPETYRVSIEDNKHQELPMDRLSAGERQLLAISVLSALIKERKGRFPVVVDTPLARLDQQHRSTLIKRFFATVSHQVVVLSTDQEVDGLAYETLKPFTNAEYSLDFDDATGCTAINSAQGAIA